MRTWASVFALGAGVLAAGSAAWADIGAGATYTSGPGTSDLYKYDLTLKNTGSTNIGVFWYAWDDSDLNFLDFVPDHLQAPAGWFPLVTYSYVPAAFNYTYGIEWYSFGTPLAAGGSLDGFSFESNDAPDFFDSISDVPPVNAGDSPFAVGTSFVYMNYPAEGPGDSGFQFVAAPVPEPGSVGLMMMGAVGLMAWRGRRRIAG